MHNSAEQGCRKVYIQRSEPGRSRLLIGVQKTLFLHIKVGKYTTCHLCILIDEHACICKLNKKTVSSIFHDHPFMHFLTLLSKICQLYQIQVVFENQISFIRAHQMVLVIIHLFSHQNSANLL